MPGYFAGDPGDEIVDQDSVREVVYELGLGRVRVLSLEGRDLAAERWYDGSHGPTSPLAQSAPANCGVCGFLVRLAGPLSQVFGVCANAHANDDGRVVSFDHGCGAHSEAQLRQEAPARSRCPSPVLDTLAVGRAREVLDPRTGWLTCRAARRGLAARAPRRSCGAGSSPSR